jgi:uncharacterized membrane protein YhhN
MAEGPGAKLAAILWFVAAILALAAAGIAYGRRGEIRWPLLAAAMFLLAMGANALKRSKIKGA